MFKGEQEVLVTVMTSISFDPVKKYKAIERFKLNTPDIDQWQVSESTGSRTFTKVERIATTYCGADMRGEDEKFIKLP